MRIVLLAGCFWGTEYALRDVAGIATLPCYAGGGGDPAAVTYYNLDSSGHSEGVLVEFADPAVIGPVLEAFVFKSAADPSPATKRRYRRAVLVEDEKTAELVRSWFAASGMTGVPVEVGFRMRPAEPEHVKRYVRMMA